MNHILFWIACYIIAGVTNGELNPYAEILSKRPWKSEQGYVEVRSGVHLFYWFYYADGTIVDAIHKPLIIWIQGGPGFAASGIANFAELGPLTMDFKPRNHTWVKGRNVLLIDHPVGAGFSYADDKSLLVNNDRDAALDLSKIIKVFFRRHKEFRKTPSYLIGQSYGGKISARLGYYLHTAIEKKRLKMNLRGIGIGSGWVDPKESSLVQPEFLYLLGIIDQNTYRKAKNIARNMVSYLDKRDYVAAEKMDIVLFQTLTSEANMQINFNNINQVSPYPALEVLEEKVNKYVKPTLSMVNQSLHWSYISDEAFNALRNSFLTPANKFLEMLLNKTKIKIAVYNGNLDVVTPLAGASNWVHKLRWYGAKEFRDANTTRITSGSNNGFYKSAKHLSFWSVYGSGHWVPEDNPEAMERILEYITSEDTH